MITLAPMTEADFQAYLAAAVQGYAADKIKAGNWTEAEALERSRREFEGYLPQGIYTPQNYLFTLLNEAHEKVGYLWYAVPPKQPELAIIYDFEIYEAFRRRGYASQALACLEEDARSRGLKQIELHVFGHNLAARELYKKAGFTESNVMMTKKIT